MIHKGSSINIIRENFENLEEKEENITVYTIKGQIKLKKSIIISRFYMYVHLLKNSTFTNFLITMISC